MSASTRVRSIPILLLALTLGVSNAAAWSNSSNLNNPIATGAGDQISPHLLADGVGGMFVNWSSTLNGGLNYHGYVQRLDPSGAPLWGAGGVLVSAAAGDQLVSVMVPDGAGGMIVCWYDTRAGNLDLYAQHYNSAGVPQWAANGVAVVAFAGNQQIGSMISDGAGGVIVAWIDDRTDPSYDVYARRVTAAGVPQWTANGTPICTVAGLQGYPEMVSDGAGGAIITWPDERAGGANSDIYAQRVNGSGAVQWAANGIPVCAAINNQYGAFAVTDGAGGAFINWYDYRGGAIPHLYGQHLNAGGSIQWAADGRQITFGSQEIGEVGVTDGSGGEYVIWDDYSHPNEPDIYAQHLNAAGLGQWGAGGSPVIDLPGSQVLNDYGPDGQGGLIVVFRDVRDGSEDLYIQRIAPNGIPQWGPSTGVALSVAPGDQDVARMAPDGAGGFVIAFEDHRNSPTTDIYAQRIHFFGQLGSPEPKIVSAKDVANDQGGQVRVSWNASYLDVGPGSLCTEYRVWRKVPTALAQARIRRGETFRITGSAAIQDFWELADSQPADGYPSYSLVAATTGDSVHGRSAARALVAALGLAAGQRLLGG